METRINIQCEHRIDATGSKVCTIKDYRRDNSIQAGTQSFQLSGVDTLNYNGSEVQHSKFGDTSQSSRSIENSLNLLADICENMPAVVGSPAVAGPSSEHNDIKEACIKSLERRNSNTSIYVSQSLLDPGFLKESQMEVSNQNYDQNYSNVMGESSSKKFISESIPCNQEGMYPIQNSGKINSRQNSELSLRVSKVSGGSTTPGHLITKTSKHDIIDNSQEECQNFPSSADGIDATQSSILTISPAKKDGGISSLGEREVFKKIYDTEKRIIKHQKFINDCRLEIAKRAHRKARDQFDTGLSKLDDKIARL